MHLIHFLIWKASLDLLMVVGERYKNECCISHGCREKCYCRGGKGRLDQEVMERVVYAQSRKQWGGEDMVSGGGIPLELTEMAKANMLTA